MTSGAQRLCPHFKARSAFELGAPPASMARSGAAPQRRAVPRTQLEENLVCSV
jgi:hypothetical protein